MAFRPRIATAIELQSQLFGDPPALGVSLEVTPLGDGSSSAVVRQHMAKRWACEPTPPLLLTESTNGCADSVVRCSGAVGVRAGSDVRAKIKHVCAPLCALFALCRRPVLLADLPLMGLVQNEPRLTAPRNKLPLAPMALGVLAPHSMCTALCRGAPAGAMHPACLPQSLGTAPTGR